MLAEVVRRSVYKGQSQAAQDESTNNLRLPIDAATVAGHLACLASQLQNRGCTADALKHGLRTIKIWDEHLQVTRRFCLLRNAGDTEIHVEHNKIILENLRSALQAGQLEGYVAIIGQCLGSEIVQVLNCARVVHSDISGTSPIMRCTSRWETCSSCSCVAVPRRH